MAEGAASAGKAEAEAKQAAPPERDEPKAGDAAPLRDDQADGASYEGGKEPEHKEGGFDMMRMSSMAFVVVAFGLLGKIGGLSGPGGNDIGTQFGNMLGQAGLGEGVNFGAPLQTMDTPGVGMSAPKITAPSIGGLGGGGMG